MLEADADGTGTQGCMRSPSLGEDLSKILDAPKATNIASKPSAHNNFVEPDYSSGCLA